MHKLNKKENAIGVFDSGVGGLSVWVKIRETLPNESIIYYADNAHCPYGSKSKDEIISYSDKITRFLLDKGCKVIVVACNTATSMAISYLRNTFNIPFIGIEPAVKPAALTSETGKIGILATEGTLKSKLFNETKARFAGDIDITLTVGQGLVEIIENNLQGTEASFTLLRKYILPMLDKGVDRLVLGCTHYPFLIDDIHTVTEGSPLKIIDPAKAVSLRLGNVLKDMDLLSESDCPSYSFYHSGEGKVLQSMLVNFGVISPKLEKINE